MNLCVYGASSDQIERVYITAGEELGRQMAARGHGLIFGGGATGLMGAVVRGVSEGGGWSLGIAPEFFHKEGVLSDQCSEFLFTKTMRQRKELMEERADGFIMTPGGIGTFEEFFEILTLKQLGRHEKPIAILNTGGYYDSLMELLAGTAAHGFMSEACLNLCAAFRKPADVLAYMEQEKGYKI
ncbi:MAG: TIGR00730 family Rossman fold protein [Firmicutes bacterium]|nr:TIGR00730 family Rossman fold protein [Bacillota bacterium]